MSECKNCSIPNQLINEQEENQGLRQMVKDLTEKLVANDTEIERLEIIVDSKVDLSRYIGVCQQRDKLQAANGELIARLKALEEVYQTAQEIKQARSWCDYGAEQKAVAKLLDELQKLEGVHEVDRTTDTE